MSTSSIGSAGAFELQGIGIMHIMQQDSVMPGCSVGHLRSSEITKHVPEVAELPLLASIQRERLQIEERVCQVVHPQRISRRVKPLPPTPGGLPHAPVGVRLQQGEFAHSAGPNMDATPD